MPRVFQDPDFQNLASTGLLLSHYYALSHPSQPNYIASVGGDYFGLDSDDVVNIPKNVSTVVDVFDTKGITWKEYLEDIPRPGFKGASSPNGLYARKHKYSAPIFATNTIHANVCPSSSLISYDSISSNASRLSNIVGFEAFIHDLNQHTLPQFSIVAPNLLNDAHDTTISYAANWTLKFLIPSLRKNSYFDNRTLILLTFDENETHSKPNSILSLLLGDAIPAFLRGTNDTTFYTHYSILSTLENNFGLPNLGRYDVGANVFSLVCSQTGYKNNATIDPSKVKLSKSYPGYLNSKNKLPIPSPNPYLAGAGAKGVLKSLSQTSGKVDTPYDGSGAAFDGESGNFPVYIIVSQNDKSGTSSLGVQKGSGTGGNVGSTLLGSIAPMAGGMIVTAALFLLFS
jgi:acid phosphatase